MPSARRLSRLCPLGKFIGLVSLFVHHLIYECVTCLIFCSTRLTRSWKRVESRSRPGEFVYENIYTEERQAWLPTEPAINPGRAIFISSILFLTLFTRPPC